MRRWADLEALREVYGTYTEVSITRFGPCTSQLGTIRERPAGRDRAPCPTLRILPGGDPSHHAREIARLDHSPVQFGRANRSPGRLVPARRLRVSATWCHRRRYFGFVTANLARRAGRNWLALSGIRTARPRDVAVAARLEEISLAGARTVRSSLQSVDVVS